MPQHSGGHPSRQSGDAADHYIAGVHLLRHHLCERRFPATSLPEITCAMRNFLLTLFFCCFSLLLRGAEQGIAPSLDISIDYSRDPFYQEIWFWALVALFFLL